MDDAISSTFAALADPTRRAILTRLARGESSVTELAAPFAMSMPAVSKHLRVLERAGLISQGRQAQRRPCRLRAAPLREAAAWIEEYRRFWEESFDRLEVYLAELQRKGDGGPEAPAAGAVSEVERAGTEVRIQEKQVGPRARKARRDKEKRYAHRRR